MIVEYTYKINKSYFKLQSSGTLLTSKDPICMDYFSLIRTHYYLDEKGIITEIVKNDSIIKETEILLTF